MDFVQALNKFSLNDYLAALSAVATIPALLTGAFGVGIVVGKRWASVQLNDEHRRTQLKEIYAPLVGILIGCHMTTAGTATRRDYFKLAFRQPLGRFRWDRFGRYLRKAFAGPYFQEPEQLSAEIEFGGSFPLTRIKEVVAGREHHADRQLLGKIARAERSRYERHGDNGLLTTEEWTLYEHIEKQHELLCKKLGLD